MKTKELEAEVMRLGDQFNRLQKDHVALLRRVDYNNLLHPPELNEGQMVWFGNTKAVVEECGKSVAKIQLMEWNPNAYNWACSRQSGEWEFSRNPRKMAVEIKDLSLKEPCKNP